MCTNKDITYDLDDSLRLVLQVSLLFAAGENGDPPRCKRIRVFLQKKIWIQESRITNVCSSVYLWVCVCSSNCMCHD